MAKARLPPQPVPNHFVTSLHPPWEDMRHLLTIPAIALAFAAAPLQPHPRGDPFALSPIVGEWQSDTVSGTSARSTCTWSPRHGAVLCEQSITAPTGVTTALTLFAPDSTDGQFVLYVLSRPGSTLNPVAFTIRDHYWYYGGQKPEGDGRYYRTVNDFTRADVYLWRQESSADGKEWAAGVHGQSRRIR